MSDTIWLHRTYFFIDALVLVSIVVFIILENYKVELSPMLRNWILGAVFLSLIPKLVGIVFLFSEDIYRLVSAGFSVLSHLLFHSKEPQAYFPERRKFVSQLALGAASIPFLGMSYGILRGKYNYRIHRIDLSFSDLPKAFDGFSIVQLSDIHSGSFDSKKEVARGIDMVNELSADLVLFTGDLVNSQAKEMNEWKTLFSQIKAPHGKYSILGNHDYGDYHHWESEAAKEANLEELKAVHREIGFKLLLNQNISITKDSDSIRIAGVENWGKMGFQKYGDLDKALHEIPKDSFIVLMSHDPSHWDEKVLHHETNVQLTLSGHTHGMQMGIEIPGFKWSPSQYVYKRWAGLYKEKNRFLYVNRGFGFLGFPGRVGILPEITYIRLHRG